MNTEFSKGTPVTVLAPASVANWNFHDDPAGACCAANTDGEEC